MQPPLAERIRPERWEDILGQPHLTSPSSPLRKLVESRQLRSMILWGPPGSGKTTIARLIISQSQLPAYSLSAITTNAKEIRSYLDQAKQNSILILFIDEIHRFNKAQQALLLDSVERGEIILIGATTENPSFELISPLRSRCLFFPTYPLSPEDLTQLIHIAKKKDPFLSQLPIEVKEVDNLLLYANGDARRLLNLLEEFILSHIEENPIQITNQAVTQQLGERIHLYDKSGEQHYDLISAFIKSIRGSDPDAALYWLARMLKGGEDIRYIGRRLLILAAEDIGNANPEALQVAVAAFQAADIVGLPEAQIILAQATTYLAASPKSNAAYVGINKAMAFVASHPDYPVPYHLRNAPTPFMKQLGYGKNYHYSHESDAPQRFFPDELPDQKFYHPKPVGIENQLRKFLENKDQIYGRRKSGE